MKLNYIGNNLECLIDIAVTKSGEFINSKEKICEFLKKKEDLNGSYAFAIILENDQIFLTRDKIGARKLFYFYDKKNLQLYASNNFIDLFAGIGGMRIGFENACKELGYDCKCVFSSEWDDKCQDTYEINFGERPEGDITKIIENNFDSIPNHDILMAGFPCQPFSNAGKRLGCGVIGLSH